MSAPVPANDVSEIIADTSFEEWTFLDEDEASTEAEEVRIQTIAFPHF